jgi:hypothetical protein
VATAIRIAVVTLARLVKTTMIAAAQSSARKVCAALVVGPRIVVQVMVTAAQRAAKFGLAPIPSAVAPILVLLGMNQMQPAAQAGVAAP